MMLRKQPFGNDPRSKNDNDLSPDEGSPPAGLDRVWSPSQTSATPVAAKTKAAAITQTLYLTQKGDTTAITASDIHQGSFSDCWVLSSFGDAALLHPTMLSNIIYDNGNGTQTVKLYTGSDGRLPNFYTQSYKPVNVVVDLKSTALVASGVNGTCSISQNVVGDQREIWPQVLEYAFAKLNGGYNAISHGGYAVIALEELTGHHADCLRPGQLTWKDFLTHVQHGDLMVFDTINSPTLPNGLIGGHSYMFKGVDIKTGQLQLVNPWGFAQPASIGFAQLQSKGILQIDIGYA